MYQLTLSQPAIKLILSISPVTGLEQHILGTLRDYGFRSRRGGYQLTRSTHQTFSTTLRVGTTANSAEQRYRDGNKTREGPSLSSCSTEKEQKRECFQ